MEMKGIAVYGNLRQEGHLRDINRFLRLLAAKVERVWVQKEFCEYLDAKNMGIRVLIPTEDFPADAEALVSIGGDGTFLHAAEWLGGREVPVIGINTGHLGFLASFSLDESDRLVEMLYRRECDVERRTVLYMRCDAAPEGYWPFALNELAVVKRLSSQLLTVRAYIDDHYLADYLADGLVLSTATGSTAYNMSVGGPILEPTLDSMIISPIAPHSLSMRPLVISGDSEVRLEVFSRVGECSVALDGRSFSLPCVDKESGGKAPSPLVISRSPFTVNVIRRPGADFGAILRDKLYWAVAPVR